MYRKYRISDEALEQGRLLGLGPRSIGRMARSAAPVSHSQGNRRHDDFIMRVNDGVVLSIVRRQTEDERDAEIARRRIAEIEANPDTLVRGAALEKRLKRW